MKMDDRSNTDLINLSDSSEQQSMDLMERKLGKGTASRQIVEKFNRRKIWR